MKIIPVRSLVVTGGGRFISLTPDVEVDLPDAVASSLVAGGNAVAVDAVPADDAGFIDQNEARDRAGLPSLDESEAYGPSPVKRPRGKRIVAAPENK